MANADEPFGQDMEQEPADELGAEQHSLADGGFTGGKLDRPGLQRLLEAIAARVRILPPPRLSMFGVTTILKNRSN
jgi:hypothetical protein